ncbi:MAG: tetratricopeptide repeat protein, partial [Candidatus Riflebacteria bacterium]|nr:tetratricopeptide repeat protein [Candidatus Riflebacteria bacterium]
MTQKANECQASLLAISQVSERLVVELSRQSLEAGRLTEALSLLEEGLTRAPHHEGLALEMARVHITMRNYREAESLLTEILAGCPNNQEAQLLVGELYEKTRNFERMRETFLKVVRQHPFHAVSHLWLGKACLSLGLNLDARDAFRKAIHLDSNLAAGHLGYARSLREEGELMAAVEEYKLTLRLEPTNPEALYELANLFDALNQKDLAQYHLRELTRLAPRESKWAQAARDRLERQAKVN